MNTISPVPDLIFSADGFTAGPHLIAIAEIKAAKLHRHDSSRVGSIRVRVTREKTHFAPTRFSVCITAHRAGADCVAHGVASEPLAALDEAFLKLERSIVSVVGSRRSERRHPHAIELQVALPKA
jgi:ribosome-associated translation inhibitor RaiA